MFTPNHIEETDHYHDTERMLAKHSAETYLMSFYISLKQTNKKSRYLWKSYENIYSIHYSSHRARLFSVMFSDRMRNNERKIICSKF